MCRVKSTLCWFLIEMKGRRGGLMASALVSGLTGPGSINLVYVAVMAGRSFVILSQGEILTYNNGLACWL